MYATGQIVDDNRVKLLSRNGKVYSSPQWRDNVQVRGARDKAGRDEGINPRTKASVIARVETLLGGSREKTGRKRGRWQARLYEVVFTLPAA